MIALDRRVLVWLAAAALAACSDHGPQGVLEPGQLAPPMFSHGSAITKLTFTSNAFAGARLALEASFTPAIYDLNGRAMTGEVVFIGLGCEEKPEFDLRDKIALIERGVCTFARKVALAEDFDAIGVIVHNNPGNAAPEDVIRMGGDPTIPPASIPAIFVALSTGNLLLEEIRGGRQVVTASAVAALSVPDELEDLSADVNTLIQAQPNTPQADQLADVAARIEVALGELAKEPPDQQAAVGNVEGAVGDLEAAVKDGLLDPTQGAAMMDRLAEVARSFAVDALDAARSRNGDATKIAEAEDYLAQGDALRQAGAYKDAVNKYKDALAKAQGA
jgi:hypothetical protein